MTDTCELKAHGLPHGLMMPKPNKEKYIHRRRSLHLRRPFKRHGGSVPQYKRPRTRCLHTDNVRGRGTGGMMNLLSVGRCER